jgi:hypothetical protein
MSPNINLDPAKQYTLATSNYCLEGQRRTSNETKQATLANKQYP